jgi:hypothetical protein
MFDTARAKAANGRFRGESMKLRLALGVAAGFLLAVSPVVPARATVVYVTYTGTVSRGSDPAGVFGQSGSLNGQAYEVLYVFDTGSYPDNNPTHNFIFGGTAFGAPSPLVGAAVLTIGDVSIDILGNKVGEIVGTNNGPNAFSQQLHRAYDANGFAVENSISNFSGELPATITTPFVYHVTSNDGGGSDFSAFGASGNLDVTTLIVSLSPPTSVVPVPLGPSTWPMMILGLVGLGFMAYRGKLKPAPMAA